MCKARSVMYRVAQSLLVVATAAAPLSAEQAPTVVLRDDHALIEAAASASTDVINWTTAGVEHVSQRWYWYRVGAGESDATINSLELQSQVLTDTDLDGGDDTLFLKYQDSGGTFGMSTRYTLSSGKAGFGVSVLNELVTVENTRDELLIFHIFGFSDPQLADTVLDTTTELVNGIQTVRTDGAIILHITAITPAPNAVETNIELTILHALADIAPDSLDGIVGPPQPYDSSWAFQWTVDVGPRGAFQIGKVTRLASGGAYCGDGVVGVGEQCDDGNLDDGDGCAADCTIEHECRLLCSAVPAGNDSDSDSEGDPYDDTDSDWGYDSDSDSDGDSESGSEFADDSDEGTDGQSLDSAGREPLRIGFEAGDHCGFVSAVIDIGCDTIPVENGELVRGLCVDPNEDDGDECFFEFRGTHGSGDRGLLEVHSRSALLIVTAIDDAGAMTTCTEDLCAATNGADDPEDEIDCGCSGSLATLTLRYNGDHAAIIEVEQKKGRVIVFAGVVQPGERFGFLGTAAGTLGSKIEIFADSERAVVIPTRCSKPIGVGSVFGDFTVVDGADRHGGTLCPID